MSEIKTKINDGDVVSFLNAVSDETKRQDSFTLLEMYIRITGEPARMWGDSMVGFGAYHYKSTRSTQEDDWPMAAFSPRKQNLTLYVMPGFGDYRELLEKLGKYKTSVSCLYIRKLADVDRAVLEEIIDRSYRAMQKAYPRA